MFKRIAGLCLRFTSVGIFLFSLSRVASQDGREQWAPPKFLGDGWWQSITTDLEGATHVAWYGSILSSDGSEHDVLTYTHLPLNGEWSPVNDVIYTRDGGYTIRNSLTSTSDGMLAVAFRSYQQHMFSSAPAQDASKVANWTPQVELDLGGYYLDLTADRHDILHFVYSGGADIVVPAGGGNREAGDCKGCGDLYYRRSPDEGKTWSDIVPISREAGTGSDRVDIFEGLSGRLFIDWDEGVDWYSGDGRAKDVRIVYSDDEGLNWSAPIILDGGGDSNNAPIQIAVTEIRNQGMLAVWRYATDIDRHIYYQISEDSGTTWTAPKAIDGFVARSINDTSLDDYELITDKLGTAHLFAVGQPSEFARQNATLYHVTYQQGIWTSPFPVFYSPEMWPEWPKASVGLQNDIHLSWFIRVRREDLQIPVLASTSPLKVYYSHLPGNLPLEAIPTFSPTATLFPTATAFQYLESTKTPFPTLEQYDPDFFIGTEDTFAANTLIGGILASALFCLGVLVALRILRR